MKPSTYLTAGEASRATGKAIPTITRAVKSGKIAGSRRGDDGEYEIDPTALFNVYPLIEQALGGKSNAQPQMLGDVTPALEQALRDVIAAKDEQIASMEAERDRVLEDKEKIAHDLEHWRKEYQETKQKLLTHEKEIADKEPEPVEEIQPPKKRWFWQSKKPELA